MKLLRFGGHGGSENESQFSKFEILTPENKFSLGLTFTLHNPFYYPLNVGVFSLF
jgi:hypothetical protein